MGLYYLCIGIVGLDSRGYVSMAVYVTSEYISAGLVVYAVFLVKSRLQNGYKRFGVKVV